MPRHRIKEKVVGRYFTWLIGRRDQVWQADGRSNRPALGRHSLGTSDYQEALKLLAELDLTMAVKRGLAEPAALVRASSNDLPLEEGRRLYMEFVGRVPVAGGVRLSTQKRYRAVFDKFLSYSQSKGLGTWDRVSTQTLQNYAAHLEVDGFAFRTQYLELTTIKQAIHWLVKRGHLSRDPRIELPLSKPQGTDTYCWQEHEIRAMLDHCRDQADLQWLGDVIVTLATTGLRISELAGLRWSNVDLTGSMIRLVDDTASGRNRGPRKKEARTLKSRRDRSFPIQEELLQVLSRMPRHADGTVFHGPRGGRLKPDVVRRALIREVLKPLASRFPSSEGEVGFADGRLHSFRHFFCSLCANRGIPQRIVMRWLGHKDSRMVEHYFHLHDDEARRQMGRIKLFADGEEAGSDVSASKG